MSYDIIPLTNMTTNKPTPEQLERGYSECKECEQCLHMQQAGHDAEMHMCAICQMMVVDRAEYFKFRDGADILGK